LIPYFSFEARTRTTRFFSIFQIEPFQLLDASHLHCIPMGMHSVVVLALVVGIGIGIGLELA
jgi:hypothetical protein